MRAAAERAPDTGRAYRWLDNLEPWSVPLGDVPAAVLAYVSETRRNGRAQPIGAVIPTGRRNDTLASLAGTMRRRGMSEPAIAAALLEENQNCEPPLAEQEVRVIAASVGRYEPVEALGRPVYAGPARALEETVAVFARWLHLPDLEPVYATLGAAAANYLPGTPVWLVLVSPPASGKTEILGSLALLPDVLQAATLTEASLLSGSPKREHGKGAKGGLLRELGDFGLVILKDMGSLLSMRPDAKSEVFAALREIYDGSWTRYVGTDGGRTLHWNGKLGMLAGATPCSIATTACSPAWGRGSFSAGFPKPAKSRPSGRSPMPATRKARCAARSPKPWPPCSPATGRTRGRSGRASETPSSLLPGSSPVPARPSSATG